MHTVTRLARATAVALSLPLAALCLTLPAPALAAPVLKYVALGDSAAAGPLIPVQDSTSPGCLRSSNNYPAVIAARLGATLTDVTCSSARTAHLTGTPQTTPTGPVPPQVTALDADTDLVTVTIGANDINLFAVALGCLDVAPVRSCSDAATAAQQRAQLADAAPGWGRALDAIARRAPNARIVVVGYGTYTRPGGCPGRQPLQARDADHLQGVVDAVNDAMAAQARARSMEFVDIRGVTTGHDICTSPDRAHYAGLIPGEPAAPLHPTALGMQAIGGYVADRLR